MAGGGGRGGVAIAIIVLAVAVEMVIVEPGSDDRGGLEDGWLIR